MELVPAGETVGPLNLPIEGPWGLAVRAEPGAVAEPRDDAEVFAFSPADVAVLVSGDTPGPVWPGTVVDPLRVVVVTTGLDEDVVTETVGGDVVGTVVGAVVGTVAGWVVGTVVGTVTVLGTVAVVTGVVIVVLTGSVIVAS